MRPAMGRLQMGHELAVLNQLYRAVFLFFLQVEHSRTPAIFLLAFQETTMAKEVEHVVVFQQIQNAVQAGLTVLDPITLGQLCSHFARQTAATRQQRDFYLLQIAQGLAQGHDFALDVDRS